MAYNDLTEEQKAKHRLYCTKAWEDLRLAQLEREPYCRFCRAKGRDTWAKVADHIEPHDGDVVKFHTNELQSLCEPCHNAQKRRVETFGHSGICDINGYPLDPNHPINVWERRRKTK